MPMFASILWPEGSYSGCLPQHFHLQNGKLLLLSCTSNLKIFTSWICFLCVFGVLYAKIRDNKIPYLDKGLYYFFCLLLSYYILLLFAFTLWEQTGCSSSWSIPRMVSKVPAKVQILFLYCFYLYGSTKHIRVCDQGKKFDLWNHAWQWSYAGNERLQADTWGEKNLTLNLGKLKKKKVMVIGAINLEAQQAQFKNTWITKLLIHVNAVFLQMENVT